MRAFGSQCLCYVVDEYFHGTAWRLGSANEMFNPIFTPYFRTLFSAIIHYLPDNTIANNRSASFHNKQTFAAQRNIEHNIRFGNKVQGRQMFGTKPLLTHVFASGEYAYFRTSVLDFACRASQT